ncbi:MAG: AAA family ATPase [Treponemataceae bacterium]
MKKDSIKKLQSYVSALHPIIYINHFDFVVVDEIIKKVQITEKIIEFNNAFGAIQFETKSPMKKYTLEDFLACQFDEGFEHEIFLVLKDIHHELQNPAVIAYLKRMAENHLNKKGDYHQTVFIVSDTVVIPRELENYITLFDIPLPTEDEIIEVIQEFIDDESENESLIEELALSFRGVNEFQIRQILNLAEATTGRITKENKKLILKEKEQLIKKSGMLELIMVTETFENIGGLENLKEWLQRKAQIFKQLDKAIKFGVDIPNGVMIIGMPGCGKSLTAQITASLFEVPLIRLDVGRLLGKYVGESENNMHRALLLAESISPCVLWIDEIEKAFSGINGGSGGGSDVTTRLFGHFLTWMQEKTSTVFIIPTANNISNLPPEFLRKGRFDELFFVDFPNENERTKIFEIHLKKRKKLHDKIDFVTLAKKTEGFNGADIESVIKETIEKAFLDNKKIITTEDLLESIKDTKSISQSLKDKIDVMKKQIEKIDIKKASK